MGNLATGHAAEAHNRALGALNMDPHLASAAEAALSLTEAV